MTQGCVLDLRMHDKKGTNVHDYSRYGNDGAVNGGVEWVEHGMRFDGSTGYLDCGNDASFDITDAITISVWVKLSALNKYQGIIGKAANIWSNTAYSLRIKDSNFIEFITSTDGTAVSPTISTITISDNIWYNIVTTFNKPNKTIYINGKQDVTESWDHDIYQSTANLGIGLYAYVAGLAYTIDGFIDQPRIYNRALTPLEIKHDYEATKHKYI